MSKDLKDIQAEYIFGENRPLYTAHLEKKAKRATMYLALVWVFLFVVGILLLKNVIGCEYPCTI